MHYDAIILGGGAAGLMCAARAGQRGRRVLLLERAEKVGKKILISGGGRCNFTNIGAGPANYLSANPHFAKSALARYTPRDFLDLVETYGISWHEKTFGQLFCDGSARQIVDMLLAECAKGDVAIRTSVDVGEVDHDGEVFRVGEDSAPALVIATGGPSIPKMGATGFAYDLARRFGLKVVEPRPALVPLTLGGEDVLFRDLSGVSAKVVASAGKVVFREAALFTHRGLSGPAILQVSSYWRPGEPVRVNFLPDRTPGWLALAKRASPRTTLRALLREALPERLADTLADRCGLERELGNQPDAALHDAEARLFAWTFHPNGSEGYAKAEVTVGGISTAELSSKSMEAKAVPGLYAIGEAVDVTGWLGGYNFQWAWASGVAAGKPCSPCIAKRRGCVRFPPETRPGRRDAGEMPLRQLQGMDASFVALETKNSPMHIGSILIYNPATAPGGFVRFKDILSFFESRMQLSRTMRQRLVRVPFDLDYPYWIEDPDFDLEYHVRHVALPEPGDWRQLCIQAARIFARPLDLTRPPWEFTVIGGLDGIAGIPKGCYAMVTKVHHAAIDGMSGIDLMEAMHTLRADDGPPAEPDPWKPEKVPNPAELLGKSYFNAVTNPLKQLEVAAKAAPGLAKALKGLVAKDFSVSGEMVAPKTRFNKVISAHRVIEGRSLPLADIKAIRALAEGSKVNDVFLAIVGGALRKYLIAKDDLPAKTLTAMAPISVRSQTEKGDMGNQVAAMVAPLGTHIEDPAERLRFVHQRTVNSKAMTEAIGARNMTEASKVSPALWMSLGAQLYTRLGLANRGMTPMFSTVVTNVPGPPVPIYSTGARLESMFGLLCLTDGMGLGHTVQSYCDEATVTFTACRELLPDPDFYAQCIEDSFEELRAAAKAAGSAPAKGKAAPRTATPRKTRPPSSKAQGGTKGASKRSTAKPTKKSKGSPQ